MRSPEIAVVIFVGFCYLIGARLVAMVGVALICAIITQAIGIHAVFGAFIAGLMIGRSARLRRADRTELEASTIGVFAPVFFAYSGLKVDLFALHGVGLPMIVLASAIVGKLWAAPLVHLICKFRVREALAVGVGMNARGGMELILALIGLSLGVLTREMYAIVIMVAIVTSLTTPPLLSWLLAGIERRPSEARRLEREKMLSRLPFTKEGAKLLVLAGGGPHAQLSVHLAAMLGNHHQASLTVFHSSRGEPTAEAEAQFDRHFELIRSIAELSGARNVYQRSGSADSIPEAIAKESERGYDAIFAGASSAEGDYALGGEVRHELVANAKTPVIITRNVGAPMPLQLVLVPTTGAAFSRLGAVLAVLYAQSARARLTSMYVKETPLVPFRSFRSPDNQNEGVHIMGDVQTLADELGVRLDKLILRSLESWTLPGRFFSRRICPVRQVREQRIVTGGPCGDGG